MLKILIGFVLFAALSLFVIFKGGDKVDMTGEKHGSETVHETPAPTTAAPATAAPAAEQTPASTPVSTTAK
ncbi:MAG: hypothetical protein EBT78_06840 [Betaproteobacteria bacterium]|jgi:hypothetical protein|nr:hypothetical protein [Betaproteobacteria bacterium]NBT67460.1 hypothetical protein [Betaproteobacteria bacterium]